MSRLIAWIARQPWCNGRVGGIAVYYAGVMADGDAQPPGRLHRAL